jgi:hypothetical protein
VFTETLDAPAGRRSFRRRTRRRMALGAATLAAALVVPGAAQANWYFSKYGAEQMAKEYVADHYARTYVSDLTTVCRPQGVRYDPAFKYHRWVCGWHDSSDDTSGAVLIVGSARGGAYGRVLVGAH